MLTTITTPKAKNIWHIIVGGSIGNINEWYNFLLFGYLSPVISEQFFPSQNQLLSLILTFTVFALNLTLVLGMTCSWGVFYQILFVWMPTYLSEIQHFSNETTLLLNSIYLTIFACLMPCVGLHVAFVWVQYWTCDWWYLSFNCHLVD